MELIKDKKGKIDLDWTNNWAEISAVGMLILALLISLISDAAVVTYLLAAISGIMVGRFNYTRRLIRDFAFYMIVFGYLVGFILGVSIRGRGEVWVCILLFMIGIWIGQLLHKNRIFK